MPVSGNLRGPNAAAGHPVCPDLPVGSLGKRLAGQLRINHLSKGANRMLFAFLSFNSGKCVILREGGAAAAGFKRMRRPGRPTERVSMNILGGKSVEHEVSIMGHAGHRRLRQRKVSARTHDITKHNSFTQAPTWGDRSLSRLPVQATASRWWAVKTQRSNRLKLANTQHRRDLARDPWHQCGRGRARCKAFLSLNIPYAGCGRQGSGHGQGR